MTNTVFWLVLVSNGGHTVIPQPYTKESTLIASKENPSER